MLFPLTFARKINALMMGTMTMSSMYRKGEWTMPTVGSSSTISSRLHPFHLHPHPFQPRDIDSTQSSLIITSSNATRRTAVTWSPPAPPDPMKTWTLTAGAMAARLR